MSRTPNHRGPPALFTLSGWGMRQSWRAPASSTSPPTGAPSGGHGRRDPWRERFTRRTRKARPSHRAA